MGKRHRMVATRERLGDHPARPNVRQMPVDILRARLRADLMGSPAAKGRGLFNEASDLSSLGSADDSSDLGSLAYSACSSSVSSPRHADALAPDDPVPYGKLSPESPSSSSSSDCRTSSSSEDRKLGDEGVALFNGAMGSTQLELFLKSAPVLLSHLLPEFAGNGVKTLRGEPRPRSAPRAEPPASEPRGARRSGPPPLTCAPCLRPQI